MEKEGNKMIVRQRRADIALSDAMPPGGCLTYDREHLLTKLGVEATIAHYADLYDSAPVGYFRLDRNGLVREANLTGAGMLGATRASLAGRPLDAFVEEGMHAAFRDFLHRVFCSGARESSDIRFLDSDRKQFLAHVEANAERNRQTCRLVVCDLGGSKALEPGGVESEERFRIMADAAPVLIWITGADQDYLWFNRMWLEFTGRELEDELGRGWMEGLHPEDLASFLRAHETAFRDHRPFTLEYRLRHRDGSYRCMLAHGAPRTSAAGAFLGYIGTCTDISERKKMEEALQHSRQILRHLVSHQERVREDERKRIARELHDDLGQNLLALRIDVAMLHNRTERSHRRLNDRARIALSHIDATMKAVRAAINNLRPTVLDLGLSAAIEWQVQEFRRRSGIACELAMEDDFALSEVCATALFRILQESLNNVLRHAQASSVQVELRRDGGMLYMRIADNGIGIYPDCRRKANSFGLVGIEERINALGGQLEVRSDAQCGTTLIVSLPMSAC